MKIWKLILIFLIGNKIISIPNKIYGILIRAIIINNIKALSKDKLVIIISHRLQNVVDCNRIFYLENGRIKEEGSHEELLSLNGSYNKLYSNQRSLEEGYKEVL